MTVATLSTEQLTEWRRLLEQGWLAFEEVGFNARDVALALLGEVETLREKKKHRQLSPANEGLTVTHESGASQPLSHGCQVAGSDEEAMLRLLNLAYAALSSIQRLGYPLDDAWPAVATEAYEEVGSYLWPDDGPPAHERLGL